MKQAYQSKTIWVNLLIVLATKLSPKAGEFISQNPEIAIIAISAVNILLRALTTKSIKLSKIGAVLSILAVSGCSTVTQKLDTDVFYKRDLTLTVNGLSHSGVGVSEYSKSYSLVIQPRGTIDLLLIRSCHREEAFEKISSGWFSKNKFQYVYEPKPGLEDTRVCPLRIDAYESGKGQHAWAYLDFKHPSYEVRGEIVCNGETSSFTGVGTCQAKSGLVQRIKFYEPIRFAHPLPTSCQKPIFIESGIYEVEPIDGECLYTFDTSTGKVGRLTLIGYSGVLVREVQ